MSDRLDYTGHLLEGAAWGEPLHPTEYPWAEPFRGGPTGGYPTGRRADYRTRIEDREEGKQLPYFETEEELSILRAEGRNLGAAEQAAIGAMGCLLNYTMGGGATFTAESPDEELTTAVQGVIDEFLLRSGFVGGVDEELHLRSREDGEAFLAVYPGEDGIARVRFIEPDQVTEPASPRPIEDWLGIEHDVNYWKFGVHTRYDAYMRCEDLQDPLGYHIVFDGSGHDWDYIPASRMLHVRRNVLAQTKRGVPDYYAVGQDISREARLRANTSQGAAVLAAIALIRRFPGTASRSDMEAVVTGNKLDGLKAPARTVGGYSVKRENFLPGTILNTREGMEYTPGPMGTLSQPVYIEVAQYLLRSIGIRWTMPEYMISGDASNANYSSTLVAESPFVKARERDQNFYRLHFLRLIWMVLRVATEAGLFARWGITTLRDLRQLVSVKVVFPKVASRDALVATQVAEIEYRNGIIDAEEWRAETEREPKTMEEIIRARAQAQAAMAQGVIAEGIWGNYP